jgi:hypothetical protein
VLQVRSQTDLFPGDSPGAEQFEMRHQELTRNQDASNAGSTSKKLTRRPSHVDLSDDSDDDSDTAVQGPANPAPSSTFNSWKAEFNLYLDTVEYIEDETDLLAWWGVS